MQLLVVFSLAVAAALAAPAEEGFYSSKYDNYNVDALVNDQAKLKGFAQCLAGKGPCSEAAGDIKAVIPEVLASNCGKCNATQRAQLRKIVLAMKEKTQEEWEEVKKAFDPNGEHKEAVLKFLSSNE